MSKLPRNQVREEVVEILRPINRERRRTQSVLQDQRPPDHPCNQFAHRDVGVGIRAACDWDHRRKLRIAEPRECASDGRDDERKRNAWSRVLGRRCRSARKQTGANDRAASHGNQTGPAKSALQPSFVQLLEQGGEGFSAEEAHVSPRVYQTESTTPYCLIDPLMRDPPRVPDDPLIPCGLTSKSAPPASRPAHRF